MLRQQFKQYIHHYHYMSISGKRIHSENVLVMYYFLTLVGSHSYGVNACDVDQDALRGVKLTSFLKGRLSDLMTVKLPGELIVV